MSANQRRNIDLVLHDIKPPVRRGPKRPPRPPKREFPVKEALVIAAIVLIVSLGGYGIYNSGFSPNASGFSASITSFFGIGNEESAGSTDSVEPGPRDSLFGVFGKIGDAISAFRDIKASVKFLSDHGFDLVFSGGGEEVISHLKNIDNSLNKFDDIGINVTGYLSKLGTLQPGGAQSAIGNISDFRDGLRGLIAFLDTDEPRRIIVLFENQSEIRPSGGFTGSYAEAVIERGSVKEIKVNDIYFPDRRLNLKVIPPIQLQGITGEWGARDANWFFNFPDSSEKALVLLEASDVYTASGVKFDGVVAFNSHFVESILAITGPIEIPEYGVTLDRDNFIFEVRDEVENSREENPRENPKKILGAMTPILLERIKQLDDSGKKDLISAVLESAIDKDLKVYFRDGRLQRFVERMGFGGTVFDIPDDFSGDYLAVVNANIAGGKSDIFIKQSITLSSKINQEGNIDDELLVTRSHSGQNEEEPLYRARNQNFIKVFTVPDASLESMDGVTRKKITPLVDYSGKGYAVDPLTSAIESTREVIDSIGAETYVESGKKVFAAWFSTDAGDTSGLKLKYGAGTVNLRNGMRYTFVFDKQSGVESEFMYSIEAPPGFIWRETMGPVFEYRGSIIPGRFTAALTLISDSR